MVKISEIARTSTFAWSSDSLPLLATGTVAGAVDINFSSSATLELWDIFSSTDKHQPIFSAQVDNRFHALAWSKPFEGRPRGLLAAAFENGVIEFWDADILINTKDINIASVHKSKKHSGPVKSLQFNPIQNHVLVTGGSHGQIFIWDTKAFDEPISPGQAMTPMDEITCVAWNNSVGHILATTGNGGYTSIWDLKTKKEVLHLSYSGPSGRANFSHVSWHPTISTKLITASDNDSCPLLLTWDLRNANAPENILQGHKKGVLSLDWCKQDPELLVSSGKDNATLLWNPITGIKLGEYPTTANWAFQTRFAPSAPDIFATASFDGKIIIQSLQDTSPPTSAKVTTNDDNEFWSELSTTETQQPVFEVKQPPKWLKNPCAVSFGFGSKLVSLKTDANGKSIVTIQKITSGDPQKSSKIFDDLKNDNFQSIIENKLSEGTLTHSNQADWEVLKTLSESGREALFKTEFDIELNNNVEEKIESEQEPSGWGDDDFFAHLGTGQTTKKDEAYVPAGNFKIFSSNETPENKKLIHLILNNKIDAAVDACLDSKKLEEALVLALDASTEIKEKVKSVYFKNNRESSLSRVLYNTSSRNVTDLVAHANIENWKEIAVGISSFSDADEYDNRMSELGDRILHSGGGRRDDAILCYLAGNALDKIAAVWLKELPEYETELLRSGTPDVTSPSDARLQALTNFVEKIATYRHLTNSTGEISGPVVEPVSKAIVEFSNLVAGSGEFELAQKFLQIIPSEFAGSEKERIRKATGTVSKSRVPSVSAGASNLSQGNIYSNVNNRYGQQARAISRSTSYAQPPVAPVAPGVPSYAQPPMPTFGGQQQPRYGQQQQPPVRPMSQPPMPPIQQQSNPYARSSNPYAPSAATNPYQAFSPRLSQVNPAVSAPPPPPPVASSRHKTDTDGWNDLPHTFKPVVTPRRATAAAVVTPQPNQYQQQPEQPAFPPSTVAPVTPRRALSNAGTSNVPPPPKGISRNSSKISVPVAPRSPKNVHAPSSKYAPPPGAEPSTPVTNGFNGAAPPTAPPPGSALSPQLNRKNPYAPTAEVNPPKVSYATPPAQIGLGMSVSAAPAPPPKNPYAPPPSQAPVGGKILPPPGSTIAPPPRIGSVGSTPQQLGLRSPQFVQSSFNGAPPPQRLPSGPSHSFPPPPAASQPPPPPPVSSQPLPPPPVASQPVAPPAPVSRAPPLQVASQPVGPPPVASQPVAPPTVSQPIAPPAPIVQNQPPAAATPPPPPAKVKHPKGDRSHIPEEAKVIYTGLSAILEAIKPQVPDKYKKHAVDMEQRLNFLFDHLNNEELSPGVVEELKQVTANIESREFNTATGLIIDIATNHGDETGNWHIGVKRLITMAEAMY
ncbi:SEC31 [[Candida] subhashii]|uniref:Protein transport protein SEC31 n=1 Tax=[Candida] subhashii TaxID=561895 RepID=A0A8J5QTE6_9ASCO|nr:SEC31 [[Candida] subhashii]KAG7662365.1 SEC31 [[Candida] subhashii]